MTHILAFESFDGGSHKQFRETLMNHSEHDWNWVTLPPNDWKWRMTIGAKELVQKAEGEGAFDKDVDVIFATSLLDVAALRALLPKPLRTTPLVLYMHENQVAYPTHDKRDATFAFINLNSVLCADKVLWNSKWNLDSFLGGIDSLLAHTKHSLKDIEQEVRAKSEIAWVPVEEPPPSIMRVKHDDDFIRVVWPHRWEHDKGPEELLELARQWTEPLNLKWILLGEQFREIPSALQTFLDEFKDDIEHAGFVQSKEAYWDWLYKADWVLSTATHEFFGIAVVESLLAGCKPWLPNRLSYPELVPHESLSASPYKDVSNTQFEAVNAHINPAKASIATKHIDSLINMTKW